MHGRIYAATPYFYVTRLDSTTVNAVWPWQSPEVFTNLKRGIILTAMVLYIRWTWNLIYIRRSCVSQIFKCRIFNPLSGRSLGYFLTAKVSLLVFCFKVGKYYPKEHSVKAENSLRCKLNKLLVYCCFSLWCWCCSWRIYGKFLSI